jgi:SNF2 family DNA or RNA helicase
VSGTPFENHITDVWSLVDFSVPGLFGNLGDFQKNISDDVFGAKKIEPLLSPIMIRRLVRDVANDLPEKVVIPQPLIMSDDEQANYERYRIEALESAESGAQVSLALLQKLRMYCTHSNLCDDAYEKEADPSMSSIKYQRFCEIVEEIISKNEKVIVFTSYKKMFDIFLTDVPARFGIEIDSINGDTPVEERQCIVDWFNNINGSAMLILNPRAAGTGLNITGANHVIHYNLEWNPSLEDQSTARAYRRGQSKTVFVYRLFYSKTVEEVVNDRIERKREIASTAVVGTDGVSERNDILRALELAPEIQGKGVRPYD